MVIPYQTTKFKSLNFFAITVYAKFNSRLTSSRLSPATQSSILFPFLSMILAAFSEANSEVKSNRATSFSPLWFFSNSTLPSAPSVA